MYVFLEMGLLLMRILKFFGLNGGMIFRRYSVMFVWGLLLLFIILILKEYRVVLFFLKYFLIFLVSDVGMLSWFENVLLSFNMSVLFWVEDIFVFLIFVFVGVFLVFGFFEYFVEIIIKVIVMSMRIVLFIDFYF